MTASTIECPLHSIRWVPWRQRGRHPQDPVPLQVVFELVITPLGLFPLQRTIPSLRAPSGTFWVLPTAPTEVIDEQLLGAVDQIVRSLRCQQSLVSLSLGDYHIYDMRDPPSPVSMENLKEIILRNADSEVVFRYIKYPSGGALRSAKGFPVKVTTTDDSGGFVSSLAVPVDSRVSALVKIWNGFAPVCQHAITALELEDPHSDHLIAHNAVAIPKFIGALPDLRLTTPGREAVRGSARDSITYSRYYAD